MLAEGQGAPEDRQRFAELLSPAGPRHSNETHIAKFPISFPARHSPDDKSHPAQVRHCRPLQRRSASPLTPAASLTPTHPQVQLAMVFISLAVCSLALLHGPLRATVPARASEALMIPNPFRGLFRAVSRGRSAMALPSQRNGVDDEYPWLFRGRLWFRPALVRSPPAGALPDGVSAVGLFGWTVGGVVALQYDESPVGPYLEYVSMGAVVSKRGAVGQWGSRLYVSNGRAERACSDVWGVPATETRIQFDEDGDWLRVDLPPTPGNVPEFRLSGWANTRSSATGAPSVASLPVLWTPTLKALWAPLVPVPLQPDVEPQLNLHDLRLSLSSFRLQLCGQQASDELGISFPVGLSVDGVVIEISEKRDEGL